MKSLFILFVGVLFGFLLGKSARIEFQPKIGESVFRERQHFKIKKAKSNDVQGAHSMATQDSNHANLPLSDLVHQEPGVGDLEDQDIGSKARLWIDLTERNIASMENNLLSLREQVKATFDNTGWKIQFDSPDNLFERLGIRSGDLITREYISQLKTDPEKSELAVRLEEILRSLE